ncbi:MAG TPA: very short patch repair endonuclease [Solirubrobacteraceae bacterium]|jgi:DNA mismatch endonuclease (patch repair protein)
MTANPSMPLSSRRSKIPSAPPASTPGVRAAMQGNRSQDTRPEMLLRSVLHGRGLRFFKNKPPVSDIRCRADVVFPGSRVAVFCDGCFWHRCPEHGVEPEANKSYWLAKLSRNVERDRQNDAALNASGWHVIRVWEHEDPEQAATRVEEAVHARRLPKAAGDPAG